jgi:hypothetical protein
MPTLVSQLSGGQLMRPGRGDAVIMERPHHIWMSPRRPLGGVPWTRGQVGDMAQRMLVGRGAVDRAGEQFPTEPRLAEIRPPIRHSATS